MQYMKIELKVLRKVLRVFITCYEAVLRDKKIRLRF